MMFLGKGVLKICSKFTGEHASRSVISIKLQSNFIEITLWNVRSPVNFLQIFRTLFHTSTSRGDLIYLKEINIPSVGYLITTISRNTTQ